MTPPSFSAARRDPPFLRRDGQFNQSLWSAENYPRLTAAYFEQPLRVAMTVFSGDRDEFGIASEARRYYETFAARQAEIDLRIMEGRHDWGLWSRCLDEALVSVLRPAPPAGHRTATSN